MDPDNPNILKVAMADPMDIMAMDDIGLVTNLQVEPMLASEEGIKNAIDKYYGSAQAMEAAEAYRQEQQSVLGGDDEDNSNDEVDNSPIVLLVKQIIEGGVRQRASDIHIEALENSVRVRYRIDGALKQVMSYDLSILAGYHSAYQDHRRYGHSREEKATGWSYHDHGGQERVRCPCFYPPYSVWREDGYETYIQGWSYKA